MTTKSIRYLYDIEYIKHYNYYDDVELDDDKVEQSYDENQNCQVYETMESITKDLESVENFSSEEEDTVANLSFSFVRVSTIIFIYLASSSILIHISLSYEFFSTRIYYLPIGL